MKYTLSVIIGLVVGFAAYSLIPQKTSVNFGAIDSGPYKATTTYALPTGPATLKNGAVLKNGSGKLGSIVITGVATGALYLYDATSTVTNNQTGTTTLVIIPASTPVGTYEFETSFSRGLVVSTSGTLPTSTITWQ